MARIRAYWKGLEVVRHSTHSMECVEVWQSCRKLSDSDRNKHKTHMNNTIQFDGERTSVSSSGNTEWYEFVVKTTRQITKSGARSIGQVHGMDGQDFSCQEEKVGDLYVYMCNATCYCD